MWSMLSLFRRKPGIDLPEPHLLPTAVMDAIDVAHIVVRFGKEYEAPRVVITLPGINPWVDSDDGSSKALANVFPELSGRQLDKAVQRLGFRTAAAVSNAIGNGQNAARSARIGGVNWDDGYRIGQW